MLTAAAEARQPSKLFDSVSFTVVVLVLLFLPSGTASADTVGKNGDDVTTVLQGRLFDSKNAELIEDGIVVLAGDTVACAGPHEACDWPDDASVKTYENATILPGLIDLHVHARPHFVGAFLPSGVTTIRDANNTLSVVDALRTADAAPRVFASGPLLDAPGSLISQMSDTAGALGEHPIDEIMPIEVDSPAEASEAVTALSDAGVDLIKLYATLDQETFQTAVHEAQEHNLKTAADLGTLATHRLDGPEVDIGEAARVGTTTIEHMSGLSLAYHRRGGNPLAEDLDESILDEIADELLETDVMMVPTLANLRLFADPEALPMDDLPGAETMAPHFEEHWAQRVFWSEQANEPMSASYRLKKALLQRLYERDMMIGAGSDTPAAPYMPPGAALHQELEALVKAEVTPKDALQAATWNARRILGQDDIGYLDEGMAADVLVVEGNPTADITDTRRIKAVWKAGELVDTEAAWSQVKVQLEEMDQPE